MLAITLGVSAASAQDSKGTDFWLAFASNYTGGTLTLFVTGEAATTGTVSIPDHPAIPFAVTPGSVTSVSIPSDAEVRGSDVVESKGIHVTALAEVTVYGLSRIPATTDAYLGLPTDAIGTEYIVLGYQGISGQPGEFAIAATQDGTTVTITPAQPIAQHPAGTPYTVSLNQGQVYQGQSSDVSGTIITSDKPVSVFGGAQCANIPPNFGTCDHVIEQLPPTSAWGKNFVSMPLATRLKGDTFRIVASQDATSVTINGANLANLDRGQFKELIVTDPAQIVSDKPILVMQYSNGTDYDNVTSDPFQMMIPPFEQFLGSYTVSTPASGFQFNFVNVVAPNGAVGSVMLDGSPIPADKFTSIGTSGFSGAQLPIELGSHTLSSPQPFGVHTYGFDSADSYGYPGGLSVSEIARVSSLNVTPKTGAAQVNTQHCLNAAVKDQNGRPLQDIRVDFAASGANTDNGFAATNADGVATFCYAGKNAGDDTVKASVGTLSDSAAVTWTAGPPAPPAPPANPPQTDVKVSVTGPQSQRVNQDVSFTATVSNGGPDAATGVALSAPVPTGATLISASSSRGSCATGATVRCPLGTLGAGASATVTLVYRTSQTGPLTASASVEGDNDTNGGNNSSSATTTVIATDALPLPPPPPSAPGTFNAIGTGTIKINGIERPADQIFVLNSGDQIDVTGGTITFTAVDGSFGTFSGVQLTARRTSGRAASTATSDVPAQVQVTQAATAGAITELTLTGGDFTVCTTPRSLSATNQTPVRQLWGSAKGKFTTKARYSSATVRGTVWLTQDRCDGSLVQVVEGVVDVLDTSLAKTVAVSAGQSYVAKPKAAAKKPPKQKKAKKKAKPKTAAAATYTTRAGDTLYGIAARKLGKGSRWQEIVRLNNLTPPYSIPPGTKLKLPKR